MSISPEKICSQVVSFLEGNVPVQLTSEDLKSYREILCLELTNNAKSKETATRAREFFNELFSRAFFKAGVNELPFSSLAGKEFVQISAGTGTPVTSKSLTKGQATEQAPAKKEAVGSQEEEVSEDEGDIKVYELLRVKHSAPESPRVIVAGDGSEEEAPASPIAAASEQPTAAPESPRVTVSDSEEEAPASPIAAATEQAAASPAPLKKEAASEEEAPAEEAPASPIAAATEQAAASPAPLKKEAASAKKEADPLPLENPAFEEDGEEVESSFSCAKTTCKVVGIAARVGAGLAVGAAIPAVVDYARNAPACNQVPIDPSVFCCSIGQLPLASLPEVTEASIGALQWANQKGKVFYKAVEAGTNMLYSDPAGTMKSVASAALTMAGAAGPYVSAARDMLPEMPSLPDMPSMIETLRSYTFPTQDCDEEGLQKSNLALIGFTATMALASVGVMWRFCKNRRRAS